MLIAENGTTYIARIQAAEESILWGMSGNRNIRLDISVAPLCSAAGYSDRYVETFSLETGVRQVVVLVSKGGRAMVVFQLVLY